MSSPPKPTGRPPISVDLDKVELLAAVGCTVEEIAAELGISKSTLLRRQKEPEFLEAIESGRARGRATLRRAQWKLAMGTAAIPPTKGNPGTPGTPGNVTAQIWLGKQMLGQRTEPEAIRETADKVIYEWAKPEQSSGQSDTIRSPASDDSTKPPVNSKDSPDP